MRYTMDDYVKSRDDNDYPNAVAIWDALAPDIDAHYRRLHGEKFNPALPPIFSSFMPKAGGTFLNNRLVHTLGYVEFHWAVTHHNSMALAYPTPRAIEVYAGGGYTCHTHAVPSPFFRMMTEPRLTQPIWVHIRHPGETCLAAYYHYRGLGQGDGTISDGRIDDVTREKTVLHDLHGTSYDGEWPAFFRQHLTFYIEWLESWLDYADEQPERVFFTWFDELKQSSVLLRRVFHHYGHDLDIPDLPDRLPEDRRRTEGSRDWRAGLTEADAALVTKADAAWTRALSIRTPPSPADLCAWSRRRETSGRRRRSPLGLVPGSKRRWGGSASLLSDQCRVNRQAHALYDE